MNSDTQKLPNLQSPKKKDKKTFNGRKTEFIF